MIHTFLCGAFRHVHHRFLTECACRPGHTAAVVTVSGGGERHFFSQSAFEFLEREIVNIHVVLFAQQVGDSIRAAQNFECIQIKTL